MSAFRLASSPQLARGLRSPGPLWSLVGGYVRGRLATPSAVAVEARWKPEGRHRRRRPVAADHFDARALAALVQMIALTNLFNRVNTTLKVQPGPWEE